jgi:NADH-quinone oxidoreductase subunit M
MGLLSIQIFLPLVGAIVLAFLPPDNRLAKMVGIGFGAAGFLVSLAIVAAFKTNSFHFQLVESVPWVAELGTRYHIGVDGITVFLIPMTTFLTLIALIYSVYVDDRTKTFMALILGLETAMLGSFLSLDLILFFTFFEATLIPMWLLVNGWGGERRNYAANKFLIYTFGGSIFMLVSILALGAQMLKIGGHLDFDLVHIQQQVAQGTLWAAGVQLETIVFWGFALAFLVKSPAFPFHTWIPDTYAESPTAAPIVSSAMVKLGTFGFLRFAFPLFPDAIKTQAPILVSLAVIGIVYGAIVAAVQKDVRRLLAYSSLSHMGFILLGLFSLSYTGMVGGAYQQLNHGVSTTAMFLLVGFFAVRRGSTKFADMGGLKAQMPVFAGLFLIAMLANVGLPGTNGFIGEFLSLMGAFESGFFGLNGLTAAFAVAACGGVVLSAVYLLYMYQQAFYGPNRDPQNRRLKDLKTWETAVGGVLVVLILWGGLYPTTFIKPMEASLQASRLMALSPAGKRPVWNDNSQEIETDNSPTGAGSLVTVEANHQPGDPVNPISVITPGKLIAVPTHRTPYGNIAAFLDSPR